MGYPAADLLDDLRRIVGAEHVLVDPDVAARYLTDWTGRWVGDAAVVRPATTAEVSAIIRLCAENNLALTPQGGNTGLVGGSVPPDGADRPWVLLSTVRLNHIGEIDRLGQTVSVGAGATLAAVRVAAATAGLDVGVDLAARDSATVGGMVATNAGGVRMVQNGDMRAQVLGLEAVLPSGEIVRRWRPVRKDNVGYHLPGLLAGSEGTLGVITGVLLRLVPRRGATAVALVGTSDVAAAQRLVAGIAGSEATLHAAELMTAAGLDLVAAHGVRVPLHAERVLLIEVSGDADTLAHYLAAHTDDVTDAVIAVGPARELWAVREAHTETIARSSTTPPLKLDVSMPLPAIGDLIGWVADLADDAGARSIPFGHVADGNIHVNLLDVDPSDADRITDAVLTYVAGRDGSISAEHGVGRAKVDYLPLERDAADIAAMRAIKSALDPLAIMNPGVIFPR